MMVRILLFLSMVSVCGTAGFSQSVIEKTAQARTQQAGAPLAATRRKAINALPFHRPLNAEKIQKWLEISSRCTMAEFELFLSPLSAEEQALIKVIQEQPAPIINRLHFENLRDVFRERALVSLGSL